jgi:hypothetical protein
MSQSEIDKEREEMVLMLRSIKLMLNWFVVAFLGGGAVISAGAWVMVQDHFEQIQMHGDVGEMKPKVERLWWKAFPDAASNNSHAEGSHL